MGFLLDFVALNKVQSHLITYTYSTTANKVDFSSMTCQPKPKICESASRYFCHQDLLPQVKEGNGEFIILISHQIIIIILMVIIIAITYVLPPASHMLSVRLALIHLNLAMVVWDLLLALTEILFKLLSQ